MVYPNISHKSSPLMNLGANTLEKKKIIELIQKRQMAPLIKNLNSD